MKGKAVTTGVSVFKTVTGFLPIPRWQFVFDIQALAHQRFGFKGFSTQDAMKGIRSPSTKQGHGRQT